MKLSHRCKITFYLPFSTQCKEKGNEKEGSSYPSFRIKSLNGTSDILNLVDSEIFLKIF